MGVGVGAGVYGVGKGGSGSVGLCAAAEPFYPSFYPYTPAPWAVWYDRHQVSHGVSDWTTTAASSGVSGFQAGLSVVGTRRAVEDGMGGGGTNGRGAAGDGVVGLGGCSRRTETSSRCGGCGNGGGASDEGGAAAGYLGAGELGKLARAAGCAQERADLARERVVAASAILGETLEMQEAERRALKEGRGGEGTVVAGIEAMLVERAREVAEQEGSLEAAIEATSGLREQAELAAEAHARALGGSQPALAAVAEQPEAAGRPGRIVGDGEMYVGGDDACVEFLQDGTPVGPDGFALVRRCALDDFALRQLRIDSVLKPAARLGDTVQGRDEDGGAQAAGQREGGGVSVGRERRRARRVLAARALRQKKEASKTARVERQAASAEKALALLEANANRRQAGQEAAEERAKRAKAAKAEVREKEYRRICEESAAEEERKILARATMTQEERDKIVEARKERKRLKRQEKKRRASRAVGKKDAEGMGTCEHTQGEDVGDSTPVCGARLARGCKGRGGALRLRSQWRSQPIRIMLDTGATKTYLTMRTARQWSGQRFEKVYVHDAQGKVMECFGGGEFWGLLRDRDGRWRDELVAKAAYESADLDMDLLSYNSLREQGWDLHVVRGHGHLTSPSGVEYPLELLDGHYYLHMVIGDRGGGDAETGPTGGDVGTAAAARVIKPGQPVLPRAQDRAVTWATSPSAGEKDTGERLCSEAAGAKGKEVVPSMEVALAADKLRREYEAYTTAHCSFAHNDDAVTLAIKTGKLKGVRRPPGFSCPACVAADPVGATFSHKRVNTRQATPLVPYHEVEIDIWGPLEVGDPSGYKYVFGAVCRAVGKFYYQPMTRKSEAGGAMRSFLNYVRSISPQLSVKFIHFKGVAIVYSDRGGEFTTTYGYTRSDFDELLKDVVRRLNTPDTPESGTTRIERMWRKLTTGTRASLIESGFDQRYFYHAMEMVADAHNWLPTSSNKLGNGEAPDETLGLPYDLLKLVPFGSKATIRKDGDKGSDKTETVFVMGLNHDGPGYRVLREDGSVRASIHVKVQPDVASHRDFLRAKRADPLGGGEFVKRHFAHGGAVDLSKTGSLGVSDLSSSIEEQTAVMRLEVQEVGAQPGHGGSRTGLQPKARAPDATAASTNSRVVMSKAQAAATIRSARDAGMVLRWRQPNPKTPGSASYLRYEQYSRVRTFERFDEARRQQFLSAKTGTAVNKVLSGDLEFDVQRGYCSFILPDQPVAAPGGGIGEEREDEDAEEEDEVPSVKRGQAQRRARRKRQLVANVAWDEPLTAEERETLARGLAERTAYVPVPESIMRAAVLSHSVNGRLPQSLKQAVASREWPEWRWALQKELGGLVGDGVWDEVDRSAMPAGVRAVPTQLLFTVKKDGTPKIRFVVRGDLTEKGMHYLEGKSSMASMEGVRMVVSFAASEDWDLNTLDFTQAFTNAPEPNPHLYCELPQLPEELRGGALGSGKCSGRVGHLRRNLYGNVAGGRVWQQFLMRWMIEDLGARLYISDRNLFEWSFGGETIRGAIHVDDVLYASSGKRVRDEFLRLVKARFKVTEGDGTEFCGIQIRRDRAAKTVTMHQEAFARKMMDKYGVWGQKIERTPYAVSGPPLERHEGEATEREQFDYAMAVGDVLWLTRTSPGLAWRAHDLARFMQCPGPDHVAAMKHVFRYILGRLSEGITYHGREDVLSRPYDHRNKLIMNYDAAFGHAGEKGTSAVSVSMNGAAIAYKVRRQTTVSNNTTEAEVKAQAMGMEMVLSLADTHGEMTHKQHGAVRSIGDSKGAEAQVRLGMDNKASASYKRSQAYCEDVVSRGLAWLDHVPGKENPVDILTKQVKNIEEFETKNAILCGETPGLYESAQVREIMSQRQ